MAQDFAVGSTVKFKPGPRSTSTVTAKVTKSTMSGFLETTDDAGKVRKVRPGNCSPA